MTNQTVKIFTKKDDLNSMQVKVTALFADFQFQEVLVTDKLQKNVENAEKFLMGTFPLLETSEGILFGSNAINLYSIFIVI
jgi:glutathione S-transferase